MIFNDFGKTQKSRNRRAASAQEEKPFPKKSGKSATARKTTQKCSQWGGMIYLQQISITIIYAFYAGADHFRKEKLIQVTLLLWADAKKVGLRRLFRLNNETGSFNPYGFQDDEVKTGFRMTR
jgi:hypothetical protein